MRAFSNRVTGGSGVTTLAVLVAALIVAPLVVVLGQAMGLGWDVASAFLFRPRIAELLRHTGALMVVCVPAAVILGVGAAWLTERTDLPWPGLWRTLLLAPLAIPAFVSAYAWISVRPDLAGFGGAALVATLAYYPFVYLPTAAMLRVLDGSDENIARSLGLGRRAAVVRTVLPRLRPAICGGALIVALHLLAEYGVLEMMRYQTFTTAILQQYAVGFSDGQGALLASVLLLLCVLVLSAELLLRGRARVARVGGGAPEPAARIPLRHWTIPALAGVLLVVALSVLVPVALVVKWFVASIDQHAVDWGSLLRVTGTSIGLAVAGGVAAVLAAIPAAWLLSRRRSALTVALERLTYVASALPGVVIALALVTISVRWLDWLYQSTTVLVAAYVILFLPRAMVTLRSGFAAAPPELSEASRSLGVGGGGTFARVVFPLALPAFLSGFVLTALAVATELTATLLLAPTGTRTLALAFWGASDELDYVRAAPYALMMIALSAPLTLILRRQLRGASERVERKEPA